MAGALVLAFVIVVVIPVGLLMGGAALSALLGWALWSEAEAANEGSDLVELNT